MDSKASGKDIILAIMDNMDESCEPLLYNTLVPSQYDVYLHRDDYNRLSAIFPRIRDESVQALDEKLAALNKKGLSLLPGLKQTKTRYEAAEKQWSVKFHIDENDELAPGDIMVDSRLALPAPVEYGVDRRGAVHRREWGHARGPAAVSPGARAFRGASARAAAERHRGERPADAEVHGLCRAVPAAAAQAGGG